MAQEPLEVAYLIIQQGPRAGKRIELCKDYTSIGRSRHCDIFLEDIAVHRKQASILWNNTGFLLRDDLVVAIVLSMGNPYKKNTLLTVIYCYSETPNLFFMLTRPHSNFSNHHRVDVNYILGKSQSRRPA